MSVEQRNALTFDQIQALSSGLSGIVFDGDGGDNTLTGNSNVNLLSGSDGNDHLDAGSMNDVMLGGAGDDQLVAGAGNDLLSGGEGQDTAVLSGTMDEYELIQNQDGTYTLTDLVEGRDGVDVLDSIEALQFSDGTISPVAFINQAFISSTDLAGLEGQTLPLGITYPGQSSNALETVWLEGLPSGSVLSAGSELDNGVWSVPANQLEGLSVDLPDDWSGTFEVSLSTPTQSTVFESNFDSNSLAGWTAISLGNSSYSWSASGGEISEESDAGSGFLGMDLGSQAPQHYSISVDVDANTGATLNNGVGLVFGFEDADNYYKASWDDYSTNYSSQSTHKDFNLIQVVNGVEVVLDTLDRAELPSEFQLEIQATANGLAVFVDGELLLQTDAEAPELGTFGLYTHDNDHGVSYDNLHVQDLTESVVINQFQVEIMGIADAPVIDVQAGIGSEDAWLALDLEVALTDLDGSESITSIRLTGVPEGTTLSAGTSLGEGIWTLTPAQLEGLEVLPPENFSGLLSFEVEVTATEADGDSTTITEPVTLEIGGVVDELELIVEPANGIAGEPIALSIQGSTGDESETLQYTIADVPDGASLSAGVDNGDGTWTLTAAQVVGLSITPPEDSEEPFDLLITATALEPASSLPLTVSLGGENWGGDPHYTIYVDGQAVASGEVTWAVPSGQAPVFQDVEVLAPFAGDGPHSVWVEFSNDHWQASVGNVHDRNLYVDRITVGDQVFEAEAEGVEYHRGGNTIDGQEGMYWNGKLDFDVTSVFQSSDSASLHVDVELPEHAPTVEAGSDQVVLESTLVTLAGTGADQDNDALTYTWVQVSGTPVQLDDPHAASPTFLAPEGLVNSDLVFELQVSDGDSVVTDSVTISVAANNDAPTADAGADLDVAEGETITLGNLSTDPEGQGLTYTWVQTSGPAIALDDPHAATPSFTAPEALANSDVTFMLIASDGTNQSVDTVTVHLSADNDAPSAFAGDAQVVDEGALVQLIGSGTDPEGQGLTYTWVQTSGTPVTLDDANATSPTFTAPEGLVNSDLTFELRVTDGTTTSIDQVTVTVAADNDAPSAHAGFDVMVEENAIVQLSGSGIDPEGQGLTYTWTQVSGPPVTLDDPHAVDPSFTAPEGVTNTTIQFQLQVSDGTNASVDTLSVTVMADDDAPSADAGADLDVAEGETITFGNFSTDPEGQGLTYTWVQTSGPAIALDDPHAATPSFTAPEALANSDVTFMLIASDGTNESMDTVTVHLWASDDAPSAFAGDTQVVDEGALVQLAGSGTDPEGQGLTYTWVQTGGTPVTLDDPNATSPTFTAPEGLVNSDLTFELRVTDGTTTSIDQVTVTVAADNDAPSAHAGYDQTGLPGTTMTLEGSAADPENQSLAYTWTQISGPTVILDDPHASQPSFAIPKTAGGEQIAFQLTVDDGISTSIDTVAITVPVVNTYIPEAAENRGVSLQDFDVDMDPINKQAQGVSAESNGRAPESGPIQELRFDGFSLTQERFLSAAELNAIDAEIAQSSDFAASFTEVERNLIHVGSVAYETENAGQEPSPQAPLPSEASDFPSEPNTIEPLEAENAVQSDAPTDLMESPTEVKLGMLAALMGALGLSKRKPSPKNLKR